MTEETRRFSTTQFAYFACTNSRYQSYTLNSDYNSLTLTKAPTYIFQYSRWESVTELQYLALITVNYR